jgi:predicted metal-dependent HD superfamily phosphohydrolase
VPTTSPSDTVSDLISRWDLLLAGLNPTGDPAATGRRLVERWAEPHRRYHDLAHLQAVLEGVDALDAHAPDPVAVELAAWYHDAVYAGAPDDEENSARVAEAELSALGLPDTLVVETARLVRLTATHDPDPGDANGEALCDADLTVLAADPVTYARYVAAVRAEYAHVPDDAFRAGRAEILQRLLDGTALFRTSIGREYWEATARANVEAELRTLTA